MGLERGEGGQTACQAGRGGQDPTGNLGLGSNQCFLTLFAKGIGWPAGGLGQKDRGRRAGRHAHTLRLSRLICGLQVCS